MKHECDSTSQGRRPDGIGSCCEQYLQLWLASHLDSGNAREPNRAEAPTPLLATSNTGRPTLPEYSAYITGASVIELPDCPFFITYAIDVVVRQATTQLEYTISRRFSQWTNLHDGLERTYPTMFLPSFPGRVLMQDNSPEFVEERLVALQSYLTWLLCEPTLSVSEPLFSFLELNAACQVKFGKVGAVSSKAR